MTINVIVINGKPRVGKDTFVDEAIDLVNTLTQVCNMGVDAFSSIEPIKGMMLQAGVDITGKTEADRKLLAVVGSALEEHSNYRTRACLDRIYKMSWGRSVGVAFIHMREPENINKLRHLLTAHFASAEDVKFHTLLIESNRAEDVQSNSADAGVDGMTYDTTIRNDGSISDLRDAAEKYLRDIGVLN